MKSTAHRVSTSAWGLGLVASAALVLAPPASAASAPQVVDMFARVINGYGVRLVDWQGYLANPYVELTVRPPQDAAFPVTNLRLTKREANSATSVVTMPILVQQDEKTGLEPSIPITFDYRYDTITGYFHEPAVRTAAEEGVRDWFRFFDLAPFDTVAAGADPNHLPGNDWQNTVNVTNDVAYNGMYVYFRGIQTPYSTGYPARNGQQVTGPLHRSTAMIFEYDESGKQLFTSLADEDWYRSIITGPVLDVYGLVMHEYGHDVAFHSDWAGMRNYVATGGAHDQDVIAYQGHAVPLDSSYHVPGDAPNWDRISGQSGGWTHLFPARRWMPTKLSLLIAENAGWTLNRELTPFLRPSIVTASLPAATVGQPYQQVLTAKGGVPRSNCATTTS